MRRLWVERDIEAPAAVVWDLLTDTACWAAWGPSVRGAELDGGVLVPGATGTVETVGGVTLSFVITSVVEGSSWSWDVEGVAATDHRVLPLGDDRCRAGFGVPWLVAPYGAVCALALRRLDALATG